MIIERNVDENGKLFLRVFNDSKENYTNLKAFRKDFLPVLGEHKIIKITEHTTVLQIPEQYDTDKVLIVFHSDLALYNNGKCLIFEYNFPRFINK